MLNNSNINDIELLCVIVKLGLGSKVLHKAKEHGISGGTVILGKGTVNNKILEFLGLADVSKEVVMMISNTELVNKALVKLDEEFKFNKPNNGIAFTTNICAVFGTRSCKGNEKVKEGDFDKIMYNSITIIVDKGRAVDVIDAATKAGSLGGTIINARGSGIHETSKVFAMEIEPEKEVVLILTKTDQTEQIVESISKEIKINEPGNGIIYIQNINKTYGLYEK
ncbi:P-II family nitrogen regulator [Clostridium sp. HCS.1]|uniref:P-II family nitrogen regulator n=1 Tax=Clostridium sp. HCS.1 TaxID=3238594 RepID=UPI003A101432